MSCNIILFSHEYPPCLGGVATIASQIFNYFNSNSDLNISVITSKRSRVLDNKYIKTLKSPTKFWFLSYIVQFKKELCNADVIICNDPAAIYNAGKYFSDNMLSKTICLIHGEEKYLNEKSFFPKALRFRKNFSKAIYMSIKTIFVSDYIMDFYKDEHKIDLNKVNNCVINPGVFSDIYPIQTECFPDTSSSKTYRFITVCRLHERKGFSHMLKVFEYLFEANIKFQWTIVGGGEYFRNLIELIKLSPIADNIKLTGTIERKDLPRLYKANDFYILLSEFNESYGLSYIEAAHFGLKPIGYSRCGVIDVFKYINNGLLLKSYLDVQGNSDEIITFIKNNNLLAGKSLRASDDFVKDLELIILNILKDKKI